MSSFGQELRQLRRRAGLSQERLAQLAGLSPEAVSLLERGRRAPRMTTIGMLADALGLPPTDRIRFIGAASDLPTRAWALPIFADTLVGRASEVAELGKLLREPEWRLLTVTGPGGVGKTRIVGAAVRDLGNAYADGVNWLALGSLTDPAAFLTAVGGALGIPQSATQSLSALIEHLAHRQMLIVLDAGEHLRQAVGAFCAELLGRTRHVQLLVTSRELLQIAGELPYPVRPLPVPEPDATLADLRATPASSLFLERSHGLTLSATDAPHIAKICRCLDGLPLAIELAAARTSVMTVRELATVLERTLGILTPQHSESQHSESQHRSGSDWPRVDSLEATVDWSYRLLSPGEQRLLNRLSVFGGSFALEAIAEVCGGDGVLDLLASLVRKSLVVRNQDHDGQARFGLLRVIREYARARLDEDGDTTDFQRRHAHYYAVLGSTAAAKLTAEDQDHWLLVLDREISNLRRAIEWSSTEDPPTALRLVGSTWRWCYLRGRYVDGRRWAIGALEHSADAPAELRAPVLSGAGTLAFLQCEYEIARVHTQASLDLYTKLGDHTGVTLALARLGSIHRERAEYDSAIALHSRGLELAMRLGDQHSIGSQLNYLSFACWLRGDLDQADDWVVRAMEVMARIGDREGTIWAMINSGAIAHYRGDHRGAEMLLRQGLDLSVEGAFREGIAWTKNMLGIVARTQGRLDEAVALQESSLAEHRELGDRWRIASVLEESAAAAIDSDDPLEAATLLGAAERIRHDIGTPIPDVEQPAVNATVRAAKQALGASYSAARMAGISRPLRH